MPLDYLFQYQQKTEVISAVFPPIPTMESTFHQPWSEPVRQRITPKLAIALIASGLFAPVLNPDTQITQNYESKWHHGWSEPVRIKKGLPAALHPFSTTFFNILPNPTNQIQGWFKPLDEPVRIKQGLKAYLQQPLAQPSLSIAPPSVFARMSAFEINRDTASFGIMVSNRVSSATVSIREIPAINGGAASLEET